MSPGWACQLRRRYIRGQKAGAPDAPTAGGRKRQNMSLEEEREFLAPFLESAAAGGVLIVAQIKAALDKRLGREVALASAYNLLHRHSWRKLAHDKRQPQSDPLAQEKWKKTPRSARRNPPRLGTRQNRQADVSGRGALWPHLRRSPVLGAQATTPSLPRHADACQHRMHAVVSGRSLGTPSKGSHHHGD